MRRPWLLAVLRPLEAAASFSSLSSPEVSSVFSLRVRGGQREGVAGRLWQRDLHLRAGSHPPGRLSRQRGSLAGSRRQRLFVYQKGGVSRPLSAALLSGRTRAWLLFDRAAFSFTRRSGGCVLHARPCPTPAETALPRPGVQPHHPHRGGAPRSVRAQAPKGLTQASRGWGARVTSTPYHLRGFPLGPQVYPLGLPSAFGKALAGSLGDGKARCSWQPQA